MEQAEVLWDHGIHIGERVEGEHKITGCHVDAFYLEVYQKGSELREEI